MFCVISASASAMGRVRGDPTSASCWSPPRCWWWACVFAWPLMSDTCWEGIDFDCTLLCIHPTLFYCTTTPSPPTVDNADAGGTKSFRERTNERVTTLTWRASRAPQKIRESIRGFPPQEGEREPRPPICLPRGKFDESVRRCGAFEICRGVFSIRAPKGWRNQFAEGEAWTRGLFFLIETRKIQY
jgi:hypothetical protein